MLALFLGFGYAVFRFLLSPEGDACCAYSTLGCVYVLVGFIAVVAIAFAVACGFSALG